MSTRTVSINNSAPRAGLVKMPTYTIQEDAPWMAAAARPTSVAPSSVYSEEPSVLIVDHDTSPRSAKSQNYNIRDSHVPDHGPQATRQSRLPIFNQVRTMLTKSPSSATSNNNNTTKWDDMPSQPPTPGKSAQSKSSAWDGVFSARRYSPGLKSLKSKKNSSNVSILRDSETGSAVSGPNSPSLGSPVGSPSPSQISVNAMPQLPGGVNAQTQVKRKPVMSISPSSNENLPPQDLLAVPDTNLHSRFSWSTAAPSEAPKRQSTDTMATGAGGRPPLMSHFSWTTVATSAAPTPNEEIGDPNDASPAPSPQLEQQAFSDPPAESILSRKRPVQRLDYEDRRPSTPRRSADLDSSFDSTPRATPASTPRALNFRETDNDATPRKLTPTSHLAPNSTGKKALPLLPFMSEQQASHLEMLITQEKNLVMQRQNIERAISDLEKIERASPLDVSFATVRDARRRLEERRETLREVKMEEMDIGIRIARARRKEDFGEGEGTLWVRRVTG